MSSAEDPAREVDGLAEEFLGRLRRGETPDVEEYERAHPALAKDIRDLFPALLLMEALKPEPPSAKAHAPVPTAIGPYRVLREIGQGGMGRVYEAEAPDGTVVAVKVPHAHLVGRAGFRARFLREAKAGIAIRHPGVVRTIASGLQEEEGVQLPYLVLERIEARTLRTLLDSVGTVSERLAREIGASIADALAAIHAAGVVHRDVKPENVFLLPDETVKLADLGVALLAEEAGRLTQPGEFVGSLLYAAPEQVERRPVDARADLYALGLVLFELVTGRHPFARPGEGGHAGRGIERPAPSLRAFAPHASPLLESVVRCLLARDPEDRPASAEETAEALRAGERSRWWRRTGGRSSPPRRPRAQGPFRGRAQELAELGEAWDAARRGEGRTVLIEGEAGIGKTRLLVAMTEQLAIEEPDARVFWAETPAVEAPFGAWPVAVALREALGESDPGATLVRLLPGKDALVGTLMRHLAGESVAGAEPRGIAASYAAAFRALSEERPLCIVVEDLHLASREEREAFGRIAAGLTSARVLLVASTRPTPERPVRLDLPSGEAVRRIVLTGLDADATGELARQALPRGAPPEEIRGLVQRSEGNPFFLLELVRATLKGRHYGPAGDSDIPESVQAILEARLAALRPEEQRLLDAAACAGDRFDPVLVCDTVGARRLEGLQAFHDLHRRHGLLVPEGDLYRFQHHLVEEAVRAGIPPALRRTYHGALGAGLEARARGTAPTGVLAQRLAHHFLLGDEPARAAPYVKAALEHIHGTLEYRRAAETAERALAVGAALPPAARAHASLVLAFCRMTYERADTAAGTFEEARRLAAEAGLPDLEARALYHLAALRRGADPVSALALEEQALARANATGDPALQAVTLGSHAMTLAMVGRREEARQRATAAVALAREGGDALVAAQVARDLGEIEFQLGRAVEARAHLEFAVATARLHGHRLLEASALMVLGKSLLLEPRAAEAVAVMTEVLGIARDLGYWRMEAVVLANLARAQDMAGDRDAARASASAAEDISARMGFHDVRVHALGVRGQIRVDAGELGPGIRDLREAARLGATSPSTASASLAFATLAGPEAWVGNVTAAQEALARRRGTLVAGAGAQELAALALVEADVAEAEERFGEAERLLREASQRSAAAGLAAETTAASLRLGMFLVERDRDAEALSALERAYRGASDAGMPGSTAVARALLSLTRGEDTGTIWIALEAQEHRIPASVCLRLEHLLGRRREDASLAERARARLERMLATLESPDRERASRDVPLHRRILREGDEADRASGRDGR